MPQDACVNDSKQLRDQLTAADPMQRAIGLHALELEVARCTGGRCGPLTQEASKFAERGIPYYSLQDRHFQDWVGKAVSYWEKLQAVQRGGVPQRAAA
jgi:hypothetical protein